MYYVINIILLYNIMASTRNKNTREDYNLEKQKNRCFTDYQDYKYSSHNFDPKFAGFGLMPAKMNGNDLTHNYVTVESQLFGIGANDLENNRSLQSPDYKHMGEHALVEKESVMVPDPLVIEKHQRHLP
jgi:hypothetical protein